MNTRTVNMFAATSEDLPLFSGAVIDIEHAAFEPAATPEVVNPLPMFDENMRPTVQPVSLDTLVSEYMALSRRELLEIVTASPVYEQWTDADFSELSFHDIMRNLLFSDSDHDLAAIDAAIRAWYKLERR